MMNQGQTLHLEGSVRRIKAARQRAQTFHPIYSYEQHRRSIFSKQKDGWRREFAGVHKNNDSFGQYAEANTANVGRATPPLDTM